MSELTEDRIREIVREEISASKAESSAVSSAEMTVFVGQLRHGAEKYIEDLKLPDAEREHLTSYMEGLFKSIG